MQSLQNILKSFIKDYSLEGGVVLHAMCGRWAEIVGKTVADHTYPHIVKGGVLTLTVDTPQWMHHLSFFKEEIITKLRPYNINEVRYKLGKLPQKTIAACETEDIKLSEDDLRYLENTLKNLNDEELKEKFRKLIVHGLKRGKK